MRALACIIVLVSGVAWAQGGAGSGERPWAAGVSKPDQKRANAIYESGNVHFDERRYAEALGLYRKALSTWDHPGIRFNAGICLVHLGKPVEAHAFFGSALRFDGKGLSDEKAEQARAYLRLLQGQLGTLVVRTTQSNVTVSLDGQVLASAPGEVRRLVAAGTHQLVAASAGMVTRTEEIDVRAGAVVERDIELHSLSSVKVDVRRRWKPWVPWVVIGAGVAVAGLAIPLEVLARGNFDTFDRELAERCPMGCFEDTLPQSVRDARSRGRLERGIAISGFVAGGVTTAVGVAMAIMNRPTVVERPSVVQAFVGPERAGAVLTLTF